MSAKSKLELLCIVCVQLGLQKLFIILSRGGRETGFFKYYSEGDAVRTKVSVRHRQGERSSEVVVKRGSTVSL